MKRGILYLPDPYTLCLLWLLLGPIATQAQYKGGTDDGYSTSRNNAQNSLPNVYKGGANDGYDRLFTGAQNLLGNIYKGGNDDGYNNSMAWNQHNLTNIYRGGANDGFDRSLQPSQNLLDNIYRGGMNDGFSRAVVVFQNPLDNIYRGGVDDGYAKSIRLNQHVLSNIYTGGIDDGYATLRVFNQHPFNSLPVVLLDLTGNWQQDDVVLQWRTSSEQNSDHFELERSVNNGNRFEPIGRVHAAGISFTEKRYTFTDRNTQHGEEFFYRLKSVDKDGQFTYSAVVRLTKANKQVSYTIYPNPGSGLFTISIKGAGNISSYYYKIFDGRGMLVLTGRITASNTPFDITRLAAGNYYVQILTAQSIETTYKIILQH